MKRERIRYIVAFVLAAGLGFLLHFLYDWSPNILFAVLSPVRESVWEHVKLIYWPLLLAGFILSRMEPEKRQSWRLAVIIASLLLLLFGWVVNVRMGVISMPVDIAAFLVILLLGFAVAAWVPVGEKWSGLLTAGVFLLGALVVLLTFLRPMGLLFADLSLADALYTLPC